MKNLITPSLKQLNIFILAICFMMFGNLLFAQSVSGTVTDKAGNPLPGATVMLKGTNIGTVTDVIGQFEINDVPENAILEISFTGYEPIEAPAAGIDLVFSLEEGATLGEVIVTAQKRGENVQKTPISLAVLSGAKMMERGLNTMDNALRTVAGVEIQQVAQGAQVFLRGIGSGIDPSLADPSVALMVDGVYNGRTEALQMGAFDMNRIEVLRGPQGTLYGRNATGGTVNVITNDPNLSTTEGRVQFTAGDYSLLKGEVMYNAPLSSNFGIRIAGLFENRGGYIDDGSDDLNQGAGRLKFLYKPSDKLSILGKVEVYRRSDHGPNVIPTPGSGGGKLFFPPPFFVTNFDPTIMNGPPFTGGAPILRYPDGWQVADPSNQWSNNPEHVPGQLERESETYNLQIDADLGSIGLLTILPGYTRTYSRLLSNYLFGSIVPFAGPTFDQTPLMDEESSVRYTTLEARLASRPSAKLKYLLGVFYLNSGPNKGFEIIPNIASTLSGQNVNTSNILQPNNTLAVFAQATYPLSEKFRATVGLRFSNDENGQGYEVSVDGVDAGSGEFSQSVDNFQYKLGIEADLAEKSLLYAHIATGFKQGGITATIPSRSFKPETLTSYEIGLKNRFFEGRMQANLSAFYYDFNDYQIWFFEALPIGDAKDINGDPIINNYQVIGNAGNSTITGAEIDIVAAPWKGGIINLSATLLNADYGALTLPDNPFVGQGEFPLEGQQVQNSPNYTFNLGINQELNLGAGTLVFGVNSKISDSYFASHELYMPGGLQEAYTRTNLNINYQINKVNVGLFINNLENDVQTLFPFPAYRRIVAPPRHLGLFVGLNF